MQLATSWMSYFNGLNSNDEFDKNIFNLWDSTIINEDSTENNIIKSLTEEPDLIIMSVAPVTRAVKILHSLHNLGGIRMRSKHRIVGLDGFTTPALPVLIGTESATSTVELRVLSYNSSRAFLSVADIGNSTIPTTGTKNFIHTRFVLLPPFIANVFITDSTRDPHQLLLNAIDLIDKFDENHSTDPLFTKASDASKHIVSFLWAAAKGLITALHSSHFLRDGEDWPSNFSFFLTAKKTPLSLNLSKQSMTVQLKVNSGKGWSKTDLKDAIKQGIVTPTDIPNFSHQLKNFWGLCAFFFGPRSIISTYLSPLMAKITQLTLTFEGA